jgi:hypothetical protein
MLCCVPGIAVDHDLGFSAAQVFELVATGSLLGMSRSPSMTQVMKTELLDREDEPGRSLPIQPAIPLHLPQQRANLAHAIDPLPFLPS